MLLILLTAFGLIHEPFSFNQVECNCKLVLKKLHRRTEAEWICTRCRLPAEGSYCTRCGQVYERPKK